MNDLDELLQVVDENDRPSDVAPKQQVWREGLLHRVARVLIFDQHSNLLVQQRGDKLLFPYRWAESVGGHVAAGESYLETAQREAEEEVGVVGLRLQELGKARLSTSFDARQPAGWIMLNKFETTYLTTVPRDISSRFAPTDEVVQIAWWPVRTVMDFVRRHPEQVTDGLADITGRYLPQFGS